MAKTSDDATLGDVASKLDTLIVLLAKSLYGGRKVNEVVLPLADLGLSVPQIAIVLDAGQRNVSNRLSEARRAAKSQEQADV